LGHSCTKKTPEATRSSGCSSFELQTRAYCVLLKSIIPYFPVSVKSAFNAFFCGIIFLETWAHPSSTEGHQHRLSTKGHREPPLKIRATCVNHTVAFFSLKVVDKTIVMWYDMFKNSTAVRKIDR
jgi:hypothetical protein